MRVFVAGATGAIGRRLVPQLVAHGHQVVATTRSADKAPALRALGAVPVIVDGLDGAAVGEAVARADPESSESLLELVRGRKMPIVGDGAGVWSWCHLDDAAGATVAALEGGLRGIYNVTDDEPARVADWLPYLAELVGAKPPLHIPVWAARIAAGEVATRWMSEGRGSSSAKLRAALAWRPTWTTWRDGFRALVDAPAHAKAAPRRAA